ncbi:sialic acid-binding Ig-like lectin 12 [Microtus pennsylvanicus]|uniref:sialic acid-binding Ig-like lectin 12 n=1 Tax=Microtus pennsylvanicus TaxID=10058 RepID=UPI003F6A681A
MMTLQVTDLTNTPDILIPETLEAGRPSNLTCSAPWACGSLAFSWTGTSMSLLSTNTAGSSVLTVTPQPRDHGTNLTCQVTLPGAAVTTRTTIRLNVSCEAGLGGLPVFLRQSGPQGGVRVWILGPKILIRGHVRIMGSCHTHLDSRWGRTVLMSPLCHSLLDAPKNLTVTISQGADSESITPENGSSLPVSEGQSLRLLCSTDSYPPANLSWILDNLSLCPSKLSKPGLLELSSVHLKHEGVYTCQAQHALGSQHFSLSLYLQRKSGLMAEVVLVAVVEVAVKVLLLGLCLIVLRLRSRGRRQQGQQCTGTIQT